MIGIGVGWVSGLFGWTLLEYVLHRFVFHERLLGARASRDHLKHHAKVDWFMPARAKAGLAVGVIGTLTAFGFVFSSVTGFAAFTSGLISGWLVYEWLHRRIHVAAPIGRYGRWARRHHLAHHFGLANKNHGVSSPIWDLAFGTYVPVAAVRVPRLHAAKFPWLVEPVAKSEDARGYRVRASWAAQYAII
jgi:sterol desaturase/sphingolipid hydroxylase (fatty acid hydroxylase superfamily)